MSFFDQYPRFYKTSETTPFRPRLDFRHHLIIEQNANLIKDKRIIDFASHDGRWTFAAIKAGASYVRGVEPRHMLVENANETFTHYGIQKRTYDFVAEDGYAELERLERENSKFDTAMVLGFLYHTARQYEVIYRLAKLGCENIIIDTEVIPNVTEPIIRLGMERTDNMSQLFSPGKDVDLTGIPSVTAVHMMLRAAGYQPQMIIAKRPFPSKHCADYRTGKRFTIIGVRD
jgi:hypothetical protein